MRELLENSLVRRFGAMLGVMVAAVLGLYFLATMVGPLMAVLYTFLFVFMLAFLPGLISLFMGSTPSSIGKLHLMLGAVAFNHHYLVQREDKWEWCPGDYGRVWIDEQWHDIEGGHNNYSVLAWRPFGILRYKDGETWKQQRADRKARELRGAKETDGGNATEERAGFDLARPPSVNGRTGTWLLDLKRVYSRGIRKIGDIELIETAEEVIERGQVDDGKMGNFGPVIETFAFMTLGVITGFGYILLT